MSNVLKVVNRDHTSRILLKYGNRQACESDGVVIIFSHRTTRGTDWQSFIFTRPVLRPRGLGNPRRRPSLVTISLQNSKVASLFHGWLRGGSRTNAWKEAKMWETMSGKVYVPSLSLLFFPMGFISTWKLDVYLFVISQGHVDFSWRSGTWEYNLCAGNLIH